MKHCQSLLILTCIFFGLLLVSLLFIILTHFYNHKKEPISKRNITQVLGYADCILYRGIAPHVSPKECPEYDTSSFGEYGVNTRSFIAITFRSTMTWSSSTCYQGFRVMVSCCPGNNG